MRTDKNFKLSKTTKRMMALGKFKSNEDRNNFKRAMIEAEATAMQAKLAKFKDKE